jgi:hypothetical protein
LNLQLENAVDGRGLAQGCRIAGDPRPDVRRGQHHVVLKMCDVVGTHAEEIETVKEIGTAVWAGATRNHGGRDVGGRIGGKAVATVPRSSGARVVCTISVSTT